MWRLTMPFEWWAWAAVESNIEELMQGAEQRTVKLGAGIRQDGARSAMVNQPPRHQGAGDGGSLLVGQGDGAREARAHVDDKQENALGSGVSHVHSQSVAKRQGPGHGD